MREQFQFPRSLYEAMELLNDEERGEVYDAIIQYGLFDKTPPWVGSKMAMFMLIKGLIDIYNEVYGEEEECNA